MQVPAEYRIRAADAQSFAQLSGISYEINSETPATGHPHTGEGVSSTISVGRPSIPAPTSHRIGLKEVYAHLSSRRT